MEGLVIALVIVLAILILFGGRFGGRTSSRRRPYRDDSAPWWTFGLLGAWFASDQDDDGRRWATEASGGVMNASGSPDERDEQDDDDGDGGDDGGDSGGDGGDGGGDGGGDD